MQNFQFLLWHVKFLKVVTTVSSIRKAGETKNSWLFLDPLENWGCRVNHYLKIWKDSWIQGITAEILLPGAEAAAVEHLNGNFDKFLEEAECGLAWEWETPGGLSLRGILHIFFSFSYRYSVRLSQ